ncbi:MAG TPA: M24 family metallopeptidase [Stellaceae bacterium]|jgi:Xaa-Pro aminopeptidase|nr:M24 family metallopeptidase [Stellaceae bacterium]
MASAGVQPPTLSFAERDRRWERVRGLMRQRGLDGMLIAGFRTREMYESYVSDDYNEGCVVFPLEGEPVIATWAHLRVLRALWSAERGEKLWIEDQRVATSGQAVAEIVAEKHLADAKLGVVGLTSQAPTEIYGGIPATFWAQFVAALPQASFEDVSEEFSYLMLVKSAEELKQVRYAADAAEAACRAIAAVAGPGVGEEVIMAEATHAMLRFGIGLRYPMIVMNSGPATLSWGPPRWTTRGEAPRILARGDLMQAELMPLCGNQEVQVQMTVACDPLDETNLTCERVARECYDAGLGGMKPGMKFSELVAIMEEPLKSSGCWAYTPLLHSVGPHFLMGRSGVNAINLAELGVRFQGAMEWRVRDAVLEEGMVFAFEPNACIGRHRVNLGGTVIVTATGCEELNHIPTTVTHKP